MSDRPMPIQPMPIEDFTPAMQVFVAGRDPGHDSLSWRTTWTGILGKAGPMADKLFPYYRSLSTENDLGPKLTELIRIAVATTTRCETCLTYRDPRVSEEIGPDVLTLIDELDRTTAFSPREQAALRFALAFGTNHHAIDDAMWETLKRHFSDREITQICLFVAHFMAMGRLGHAMRLVDAHCTLPGYRLDELMAAAG